MKKKRHDTYPVQGGDARVAELERQVASLKEQLRLAEDECRVGSLPGASVAELEGQVVSLKEQLRLAEDECRVSVLL
ncbi:hypothetical protein T484DRAFT_1835383 [Baffinella frigidus]|nr:hypothetical protein T484DRAFT_1835383 [Cryptophyta sp. CCMP2293]